MDRDLIVMFVALALLPVAFGAYALAEQHATADDAPTTAGATFAAAPDADDVAHCPAATNSTAANATPTPA